MAGWHLKLPVSAHERIEVQVPLGSAAAGVPVELASAVRARARTAPLGPVVVLRTLRTVHLLRDRSGRVLAEVADDAVTTYSPEADDHVVDAWREWEVELVEGDRDLLVTTVHELHEAGAAVSGWPSKLAHALGQRLTAGSDTEGEPAGAGSAGAVLAAHLQAQRDDLLTYDPRVRRDEPDSVHKMRVATRQLRSALATFRPLLQDHAGEALRDELRWLGEILGEARDAEVARDRLVELVEAEAAELVAGPVGSRLEEDRVGAYRAAHREVLVVLYTERYFRLLDSLDALVDHLPLTESAARAAEEVLPARVRHEWKHLARAFRAAGKSPAGPGRDARLHETRKAAKRARYAAKAVSPALGRPAKRFARAAKDLQTLLGDHHDSVELRKVLRRVCAEAEAAGESGFTYGRLHALAQAQAEHLETQLPAAWARMSARKKRRWLG